LLLADQHTVLGGGESAEVELDYVTLASMTEGYTASDLKDLVGGALQQAVVRCTQANEPVSLS
jgi:peroxin-1